MQSIINKIDILANELKSLDPLSAQNQKRLDKKFRLEFNYNSNHIEGNTLTYGETALLLIFDRTEGRHELREYEEMKAHDVAFKLIKEWSMDKERPLTETNIKNLNEILLVRPFWKEAIIQGGQPTNRLIKIGNYKEYPNHVRLQNGEIFEYATPIETPIKMDELMEWYRAELENGKLHPVELAALFHYKFVCIHPFDDGNGRISRLLMNYVLIKNNFPPVIIKTDDKKNYLNALNQADVGNTNAFIRYVAEQLIWSLEISIKAAKGENIDEHGDLEKKINLLKKKLGRKADEIVSVKYSIDSVLDIIKNSINLLINEWETKLKEFDSLFFSRNCQIAFDNQLAKSGLNIIETFLRLTHEYFSSNINQDGIKLKEINFHTAFQKLRTLATNENYHGGEIKVVFHNNVYEIYFTGSKEPINKLYDEYLDDNEIEMIVETIGNWLFNNIETALENESK